MAIEINTIVNSGPLDKGKKVGNLELLDAKFFGRPNFSGVLDRFKDDRRKFTVLIPNDVADQLRGMGWNVKTNIPSEAELIEFPDRKPISHLKVMVDDGSMIQLRMGDTVQNLTVENFGAMDRVRVEKMDMELRAWEYDKEEKPGEYSARLVALVAFIELNAMERRHGIV